VFFILYWNAERAKADADAARAAGEGQAQEARDAAAQAERDRAQLRDQLRQELSVILEARETARGLFVNESDVLFDTGRANLKPGARDKLARVAGILAAHPALRIEIEGHTDSVGSEDYNQRLSERRAESVHAYMMQQGINQAIVGTAGFGESRPVATNELAIPTELVTVVPRHLLDAVNRERVQAVAGQLELHDARQVEGAEHLAGRQPFTQEADRLVRNECRGVSGFVHQHGAADEVPARARQIEKAHKTRNDQCRSRVPPSTPPALERDPAVVGAIGMLAGFCGTLMTPMAANFNLVPAALLELKDQYGVIRAQVATALPLLFVNILLIYWLAF
jgi:outer membrane protein OmpA-like peptidoglycan-associated protein